MKKIHMRWLVLGCVLAVLTVAGCSSRQEGLEAPPADAAMNNNAPGAQGAPPAPVSPYVPKMAYMKGRRS